MERQVTLVSKDAEKIVVDRSVVALSTTLNNLFRNLGIDDSSEDMPIPLPNVSSVILRKVIEWCEHHRGETIIDHVSDEKKITPDTIPEWDREYFSDSKMDQNTLFELILAANYLEIKPLLDLGCMTVANQIRGKKPEAVRRHFNIVNDFSKEEEEQIIIENAWCED